MRDTPTSQLDVIPSDERTLLLEQTRTVAPYPRHLCVHQLFERQVERSPEAPALVYEQLSFSYAELNSHANRLAHHLISLGVHPEDRIAVCLPRGPAMIIGLLAILKAGGAYVPLDPDYPRQHLIHILSDASPSLLLCNASDRAALEKHTGTLPIVELTPPSTLWAHLPNTNPDPSTLGLSSHHLAYVIYTSGSTGTPKGVMVEHRNVVHLAIDGAPAELTASSITALASNPAFDATTWEVWGTLLHGAKLVIIRNDVLLDSSRLKALLRSEGVNVLHFSTGLFNHHHGALGGFFGTLDCLMFGGDRADIHAVAQVQRNAFPPRKLVNCYGPTETTTFTATFTVARVSEGQHRIPIGRPIANARIYLLDAHYQPVPLGAIGEIYVGGAGVARGYLNRADLTAERFLEDPFSPHPNARMYRTGDLARYLPDGNLDFLGRNDQQVKIRGFRIEPAEIEAHLTAHPQVREAVVLAREGATHTSRGERSEAGPWPEGKRAGGAQTAESGDKRLVAYFTAATQSKLAPGELALVLHEYLSTRLPDHMVPAAYVRLEALPLTPNGKLDRKALPAPKDDAHARRVYEAPQGPIEQTLASLWQELLGVSLIGRHDNFFELGGHSLLAVRLMSRLPQFLGVELPPSTLFAHPTIGSLAPAIAAAQQQPSLLLPPIPAIQHTSSRPLSFSQQRMCFLTQLEGVSTTYQLPLGLDLRGPLDVGAWRRSLNALFARHETLRSVFVSIEGRPHLELLPADAGIPWLEYDLQPLDNARQQLEQLCTEEAAMPFDLAHGPLIRARLIRLDEQHHLFLLTQHHIVSDGWSMGVLLRELNSLYTAFCQGHPDPLPPLSIQYSDYAAWQRQWLTGQRLHVHSEYWRGALSGAPAFLELPTDRPRPPQQSFQGARIPVQIDQELSAAVKHLSQQHGTTLFMTLMAAWATVLARLCGQNDLVIGTPSANRNRPEIEPLIGLFVNTLALRIDLTDNPSVAELLARVRQTALAAQEHQDLPFEQVVEILQPPRRLDRTPLFQVMFSWQNNQETRFCLPHLTVAPAHMPFNRVKFDLELALQEAGEGIVGSLSYPTALFDAATIERQVGYLLRVLRAMVADAAQPVARLPLLDNPERTLLLQTWNQTDTPYPQHLCLHQLFEQQVERSPEAPALVCEQLSLSYRELNSQANRLAHHLLSFGVRPDDRIALCVERGPAMVIGLLAILKSGGAYVPLDPDYPSARLVHILFDASSRLLLCDTTGRSALGENARALPILDLDAPVAPWSHLPDTNPDPNTLGLTSHHLAYVIYTSGSTGTPKGVMVEHRNVANFLLSMAATLGIGTRDRLLAVTSISFDIAALELYLPLSQGARVVLARSDHSSDPYQLQRLLATHAISFMQATPATWRALLDSNWGTSPVLRMLCGGETLTADLAVRLLNHGQDLWNLYGPTETTIWSTCAKIMDKNDACHPSLGRPIANTRIYVLDGQGRPVPLGVIGEIYIGGIGVARGYLNRPALTAERFLQDPFSAQPNARMYRTGDLARYLPGGNIEFLGRNDQQIKIRGFRIEPAEIEMYLTAHPQVHEAVVLAREVGMYTSHGKGHEAGPWADGKRAGHAQPADAGDKRLIAYVTTPANSTLSPGEIAPLLREHLSARLPEYMVPAAYVRLNALPLTPNGKLDRNALPAPEDEAYARRAYEPPQGEIEQALASLWQELLGVSLISRHDNFFALGGHSIIAMRSIGLLSEKFQADIPIRILFEAPTLAQLTAYLQGDMPSNQKEGYAIPADTEEGVI